MKTLLEVIKLNKGNIDKVEIGKTKNTNQYYDVHTGGSQNDFDMKIYKVDQNEGTIHDTGKTRKIEIPQGKYVVYRDHYHHSLHIADLEDMLYAIAGNIFHYEDFSSKDIIAGFDTLRDAVLWVLDQCGALTDEFKKMYEDKDVEQEDIEEYIDKYRNKFKGGLYDSTYFMGDALTGRYDNENVPEYIKDPQKIIDDQIKSVGEWEIV